MAAAAINHLRDLPHKLRKASNNDSSSPASPSGGNGNRHGSLARKESRQEHREHENERKQILHWEADKHTLKPEEIVRRGEDKHVGFSSHRLNVNDFHLLKTLGTGMAYHRI